MEMAAGVRLVEGYCYYDPKREQDERNSFYNRLYDVIERVQEKDE
jgi:hypothetical protein